ncbi:hypothetical protein J4461_04060 [Candidatus Pacearchaeota archaeon]|nr:hypothetical protein [Candidatus Pacearchaeota archaeon]
MNDWSSVMQDFLCRKLYNEYGLSEEPLANLVGFYFANSSAKIGLYQFREFAVYAAIKPMISKSVSTIKKYCRFLVNPLNHPESRLDELINKAEDQEFAQALHEFNTRLSERRLQLGRASLDRANHN